MLSDIADRCELNLAIPEALQGTTSVKLRDVSWKQAFNVVLQPIAYTYVEAGRIVRVVAVEDLSPTDSKIIITKQGNASGWLDGSWYTVAFFGVFGLVLVVCHVVLFIGVLRDVLPNGTRFAPKIVWATLILIGGVIPLVGYWIIHHSNLSENNKRS